MVPLLPASIEDARIYFFEYWRYYIENDFSRVAVPDDMPFEDKYDSLECILSVIVVFTYKNCPGTIDLIFEIIDYLKTDAIEKWFIVNLLTASQLFIYRFHNKIKLNNKQVATLNGLLYDDDYGDLFTHGAQCLLESNDQCS